MKGLGDPESRRRCAMVLGLTAVPHSGTQLLHEGTSQEKGNRMAVWHMAWAGAGAWYFNTDYNFFTMYQLCPHYIVVDRRIFSFNIFKTGCQTCFFLSCKKIIINLNFKRLFLLGYYAGWWSCVFQLPAWASWPEYWNLSSAVEHSHVFCLQCSPSPFSQLFSPGLFTTFPYFSPSYLFMNSVFHDVIWVRL